MSVTITDNPITSTLHSTLQDYEIHVTGDTGDIDQTLNERGSSSSDQNPPYWPRDHHRVPNYRPINRNLNLDERPRGSNPIERAFIFAMFTGVAMNAVRKVHENQVPMYQLTRVRALGYGSSLG